MCWRKEVHISWLFLLRKYMWIVHWFREKKWSQSWKVSMFRQLSWVLALFQWAVHGLLDYSSVRVSNATLQGMKAGTENNLPVVSHLEGGDVIVWKLSSCLQITCSGLIMTECCFCLMLRPLLQLNLGGFLTFTLHSLCTCFQHRSRGQHSYYHKILLVSGS